MNSAELITVLTARVRYLQGKLNEFNEEWERYEAALGVAFPQRSMIGTVLLALIPGTGITQYTGRQVFDREWARQVGPRVATLRSAHNRLVQVLNDPPSPSPSMEQASRLDGLVRVARPLIDQSTAAIRKWNASRMRTVNPANTSLIGAVFFDYDRLVGVDTTGPRPVLPDQPTTGAGGGDFGYTGQNLMKTATWIGVGVTALVGTVMIVNKVGKKRKRDARNVRAASGTASTGTQIPARRVSATSGQPGSRR